MEHESHSLLIMHGSACQLNESGERGSSSPIPIIDAAAPVPPTITSVVSIIIILLFRGFGVGNSGNPLPQLSHNFVQILASVGSRRYKTGQEQTLGNHFCPHRSYVRSWCRHIG